MDNVRNNYFRRRGTFGWSSVSKVLIRRLISDDLLVKQIAGDEAPRSLLGSTIARLRTPSFDWRGSHLTVGFYSDMSNRVFLSFLSP